MSSPPTHYAPSGDASIAYQVLGEGPCDLVVTTGPASHLELMWEEPRTARTFRTMAEFARLIMFDRRGTGLSDAVSGPPTLEQQVDDLRAVLAAAGSERAAMIGGSDLGLTALFAATYPDEVSALVLSGVAADGAHTFGGPAKEHMLDAIERSWGDGTLVSLFAPSQIDNRVFVEWWGRMQRSAVSPGMARRLMEMTEQTNLRAILPTIRVPTLVIHITGDRVVPVECGREVAALIPGARFIEYPGEDAYVWIDPLGMAHIGEFLTGRRSTPRTDRVLATVLFTDIVGSTEQLSSSETRAGAHNSTSTTALSARACVAGAGTRSRPAATASWPRLTVPPARSIARPRSSTGWRLSDSTSAPACTPANASCARMTWRGSPSTSPRA